jgi:hypothetical protein
MEVLASEIGEWNRCDGVMNRCDGVMNRCDGVMNRCDGVMNRCDGVLDVEGCAGVIRLSVLGVLYVEC